MTSHNNHTSSLEQSNQIQDVRNQIVDAVLVVGALISFISISFTIINGLELGWQSETTGFIVLVLWLAVLAIFRKRIPYHLKAITIIIILYIGSILSLFGWGLSSSGEIWFLVMVLLTMIFYDIRAGLISYAIVVITMTTITFALNGGLLTFDVDFEAYAYSSSAWLSQLFTVILVSALLVAILGRIITVLQEQLDQFRQRSDELAQRTIELTHEMKKREDAEMSLELVVERLKDLDKLKDNFIDSVSHELRTPIANIQLYHQLLAMNPAKKDTYMATLNEETGRLTHIVEQLIQASGDTYDMALTTMVDIDLKALIISLFEEHRASLADNQIVLQLPETDEDFISMAAPEHIFRSLNNLVDNAVKYTDPGGTILVRLHHDKSRDPAMIAVLIQNTGDCPSPDEQKNIFERFVRGESSLKKGIPGAGLGLSIARQIVEQYNGHIDFSCDENTRTLAFTFCLPSVRVISEKLPDENPLS